jgi:hypothetical protein
MGISSEGERLFLYTNTFCFAPLRYFEKQNVKYFMCYYDLHRSNSEHSKAYLRWLYNESVWKEVYKDRNVDKTYKNGCILNTHYPTEIVVQAAVLYRYVYEFPNIISAWYGINQIINHPFIALLLAHYYQASGLRMFGNNSNHFFWSDCIGLTKDFVYNIINNNRQHWDRGLFSDTTRYSHLSSPWDQDNSGLIELTSDFVKTRDDILKGARKHAEASINN